LRKPFLDVLIDRAAIRKRSEGRVERAERAPIGAGDFLLAHQNAKVAARGCLRNAEAGADFGEGNVTILEQFGQRLSPGKYNRSRDFHAVNLKSYMIEVNRLVFRVAVAVPCDGAFLLPFRHPVCWKS
jgi:hypothetical protein